MMQDFRHMYCLFCETRKEEIAKILCEKMLGVKAILLTTEKFRFYRGEHKKMTVRVLPSYIFLYFNEDIDLHRITQIEHVFRVLSMSGEYELHERDQKFAKWAYESSGSVGISLAYREGDHIVVVDGPLKDYEGDIVWVDKRKGKAKVHIVTESLDTNMWLFFEYIEKPNQPITLLKPE